MNVQKIYHIPIDLCLINKFTFVIVTQTSYKFKALLLWENSTELFMFI